MFPMFPMFYMPLTGIQTRRRRQLQFILQEGEGPRIEFKEAVNASLARELVALANAAGGRVLLGVADNRSRPGIAVDNRTRSRVQDIADNCTPPVGFHPRLCDTPQAMLRQNVACILDYAGHDCCSISKHDVS